MESDLLFFVFTDVMDEQADDAMVSFCRSRSRGLILVEQSSHKKSRTR